MRLTKKQREQVTVMGMMQRQKGKRFEREIAAEFRKLFPDVVVRRASQAERADNPDVFIEGGPPILSRLWLELQDSRNPTPTTKLAQATRDIAAWKVRRESEADRLPVVIWHRLNGRDNYVTTRLWVTCALARSACPVDVEVTMGFEAFARLLVYAAQAEEARAA